MGKAAREPAPQAPAKAEWKEPENFAGFIKEVVKAVGKKSGKAEVVDKVTELYGSEAQVWIESKAGLSVAINNANKFHGFSETDDKPKTKRTDGTEPTLSDMTRALDVCSTVGMPAGKLLGMVRELSSFGEIKTLEACLEAIERIQGAKGK